MKNFLILITFFFLITSTSNSNENSIVIDINYLIENSKKGLALKKKISSKRDKNTTNFEKSAKNLKEKENKLV